MTWAVAEIIGGLVVLLIGGDLLVRGASGLAVIARVAPLIIGLTVVSFGTSAPELAVSLQASYQGNAEIAIGNALGSNIFNVLVVLGLAAMVTPLAVSGALLRRDLWWMLATAVALIPIGWDGSINRVEGGILAACLLLYIAWLIRASRIADRQLKKEWQDEFPLARPTLSNSLKYLILLIIGLGMLVVGSKWLTIGAVQIARAFNVSELVIGLTIIAVGTSLPEVVTSVMAGLRGERDIAVGNVVGSNIFNVLCVIGLASLFGKNSLPFPGDAFHFDLMIVIGISALCIPVFFIGRTVSRLNGAMFVISYVLYTIFLIFDATEANTDILKNLFVFALVPAMVVCIIYEYLIWSRPRQASSGE